MEPIPIQMNKTAGRPARAIVPTFIGGQNFMESGGNDKVERYKRK